MNFPSKLVETAVNHLSRLPGIGKKSALRLVLHMLKQEKIQVQQFGESFIKLINNISYCKVCFSISDLELCEVCANPKRDKNIRKKTLQKVPKLSKTRTTSKQRCEDWGGWNGGLVGNRSFLREVMLFGGFWKSIFQRDLYHVLELLEAALWRFFFLVSFLAKVWWTFWSFQGSEQWGIVRQFR